MKKILLAIAILMIIVIVGCSTVSKKSKISAPAQASTGFLNNKDCSNPDIDKDEAPGDIPSVPPKQE